MAYTYTAYVNNIISANGKSIFALWNPASSGYTIYVYRIGLVETDIASVTGVMSNLSLRLISACSSGDTISIIKHNSNNPDMPGSSGIIAASNATVTSGSVLRRLAWSTDEPRNNSASNDEYQGNISLCIIWNAGYKDIRVQPLTLREGEGLHIQFDTDTTTGNIDVWSEFVVEEIV